MSGSYTTSCVICSLLANKKSTLTFRIPHDMRNCSTFACLSSTKGPREAVSGRYNDKYLISSLSSSIEEPTNGLLLLGQMINISPGLGLGQMFVNDLIDSQSYSPSNMHFSQEHLHDSTCQRQTRAYQKDLSESLSTDAAICHTWHAQHPNCLTSLLLPQTPSNQNLVTLEHPL